MAEREVQQAGGVVVLAGEIVLRRTAAGEWVLPKGHLEPGETLAEAAHREVLEETGLDAAMVGFVGVDRFRFAGEPRVVTYFLMRAAGPTAAWLEHRGHDAEAFSPDQALTLATHAGTRAILQRALAELGSG